MKKVFLFTSFTLIIGLNVFPLNIGSNPQLVDQYYRQDNSIEKFLDFKKIVYKHNTFLEPDTFSINWGLAILNRLDLKELSNYDKAKMINQFIYYQFKYTSNRYFYLNDIIQQKKGNCRSHANLSIFLLRLAGIPAKYAHEMHITKKSLHSIYIGFVAKKKKEGINGFAHNDHAWVWFFDGEDWLPFDSSLGIIGYDELFAKRFFKHKELSKNYIEKVTGPPFVIWMDNGMGLDEMINVSTDFHNKLPNIQAKVIKDDWLDLSSSFNNYSRRDLYFKQLPVDLEIKIKRIRKAFDF
jgi:hypothetical protein